MDNTRTTPVQPRPFDLVAAALVIVGGLNWGLVALAEFDLVAWIAGETFGATNVVSRIVYGLVGLAAVYSVVSLISRRQAAGSHRPAPAAR